MKENRLQALLLLNERSWYYGLCQARNHEKIKQVDLLTYLLNYQPERLKKISHDTYCIRDHDSLHISNGLWHWQSMGIGGKSALDFLIKVDNYAFWMLLRLLQII